MSQLGCGTLCLALLLACLLPIFFPGPMGSSLDKLGLPPDVAGLILLGMFIGSAIDIPLRRVPIKRMVRTDPLAVLGLSGALPHLETHGTTSTIALNVGGCLIPVAVVMLQLVRLTSTSTLSSLVGTGDAPLSAPAVLIALAVATVLATAGSWRIARVVSGVGIRVPGVVPAMIAGATALVLAPRVAPPVALVAGVVGPLLGADLLRLRDLRAHPVGMQSIGGAGTFDAIVLSSVVAAFLG
jgi:uncharacterized membrane protein